MTYDDFKLQDLEEFNEFRYYKGEKQNPYTFNANSIEFRWLNFEKDYFNNYKESGKWKTFTDFLNQWIKEKAAPEIGYDLKNGNTWLIEYEAYSPYK